MRSQTPAAPSDRANQRDAFPWKFVTPLFRGSALNPVNSPIIATALVPTATAMHISVGTSAVLVSAPRRKISKRTLVRSARVPLTLVRKSCLTSCSMRLRLCSCIVFSRIV